MKHGLLTGYICVFMTAGCEPSMRDESATRHATTNAETFNQESGSKNGQASATNRLPKCCCNVELHGKSTDWISPERRLALETLPITCEDSHGRSATLAEWISGPTLLMFFYSRCDNPLMCDRTASSVAKLQEQPALPVEARLLLMTFEPDIDNAAALQRFAALHNIDTTKDNVHLLRVTERNSLEKLLVELSVPVAFSTGSVGIHDHAGYVFDKHGRLARVYLGVLPDHDDVINDLTKLSVEGNK